MGTPSEKKNLKHLLGTFKIRICTLIHWADLGRNLMIHIIGPFNDLHFVVFIKYITNDIKFICWITILSILLTCMGFWALLWENLVCTWKFQMWLVFSKSFLHYKINQFSSFINCHLTYKSCKCVLQTFGHLHTNNLHLVQCDIF